MTAIDTLSDLAHGARTANIQALPIPPYRGTSLPEIDYDAHPAYGGMFPKASLRERLHALNIFLRTFAFVSIRRIVDYDNMPLLTKEAGFRSEEHTSELQSQSNFVCRLLLEK